MANELIQKFLPDYKLRQVDRVRLAAPPTQAWPVIRELDAFELPISKLLFSLRTLPDLVSGKAKATDAHSKIEDFTGPDKGFMILAEKPFEEIVVGSVGQFWKLNIPFKNVEPRDFAGFNEKNYGKLAWNLRLDPDSHGGSWLTWDLRVTATDSASWKKFNKYWILIGSFSHLLRRMALKMFQEKLGSADEEILSLPGDEIILTPRFQKTMSTTVEKPVAAVWPWLVQMGCRRAGWYSIDWLDNGGVKSAKKIIPELQNLKIGDVLPMTPQGKTGFIVQSIELGKSLVVTSPAVGEDGKPLSFKDSWAFVLEPIGPNATRLLTRVRAEYEPSLRMKIFEKWIGPVHYLMERVQLRNIKLRAEKEG